MLTKLINIFNSKDKPLLGIDIASESVKVLELEFSRGKYIVDSFYSLQIDSSMVREGKISDISGLGNAIARTVNLAGSKSKLASIGIPSSLTISRTLSFPESFSLRDVESEIKHDAEGLIPYPLEEVSFDFTQIPSSSSGTKDYLLAATRNENIEERLDVLAVAGLTPSIVDIESYAIQNAFSLIRGQIDGHGDDTVVALFDIGSSRTTLFVLKGGSIIFSRDESFGGSLLTSSISQKYGLGLAEAEALKLSKDLPEDYESEVLNPFKVGLAQSVNRMVQFFLSASSSIGDVDHVVLSGGCAAIEGLDDYVGRAVGLPSSIANPLKDMKLAKRVNKEKIASVAPSLMIACGLAMRSGSND